MTAPRPDHVVGLGRLVVSQSAETLAVLGLGSCVAVIMDDRERAIGGIVHVLLPSQSLSRDRSNPARFAETAVPVLVGEMERAGASRSAISARLVGGAAMFSTLTPAGSVHIGQRNVAAARLACRSAGLRMAGEAVGGMVGRSVWFDVATGIVTVRTVGGEPEQL